MTPHRQNTPGHWMNEASGLLQPAMLRYLRHEELTVRDISLIRAYLRQWIWNGDWAGEELEGLRDTVPSLINRRSIERWVARAVAAGMDPL